MLQKIRNQLTQKFTEKQINTISAISGVVLGLLSAILCWFVGDWLAEIFFL